MSIQAKLAALAINLKKIARLVSIIMPDFFIVLNEISQLWFSNIKDEMKLHKLLYFAQRETIAILGQPMFDAEFEGWKHGPVCRKIREAFTESGIDASYTGISFDSAYIVRNVIEEYGVLETWQLRNLSHREISWKNSRIGLNNNEAGVVLLKLSDISEYVADVEHLVSVKVNIIGGEIEHPRRSS